MYWRRFLAGCLFAFLLLPASLAAFETQEEKQKNANENVDFDFREFGEIPVRFNYRVTTIDRAARSLLTEVSGRSVWYDAKDQKRPASGWYLDLIALDGPLSQPVLLLENAELRKLLELPARDRSGPNRNRYSAEEVLRRQETLNELYEEAVKRYSPFPAQTTARDRAVGDLMHRLMLSGMLRQSCLVPRIDANTTAEMIQQQLARIEAAVIPLPIPPTDEAPGWHSYAWAGLLSLLQKAESDVNSNPAVQSFSDILTAYQKADAKAFNRAVAVHRKNMSTEKALRTPFSINPPSGWTERCLSAVPELNFYEDARSPGTKLISLYQTNHEADETSTFDVNYFEGEIAESWRIVNHWRYADGLAPQTKQQLTKLIKNKTIAGLELEYVTFSTAATSPRPGYQLVGAILHRGNSHWVMTLFAPQNDGVAPTSEFESILNNFQLGEEAEVLNWLGTSPDLQAAPIFAGMRSLAALVPDGKTTWVLEMSGFAPCLEMNRTGFVELVKSIRFAEPREGDQNLRTDRDWRISWSLPTNARLGSAADSDFVAMIELTAVSDRPVFVGVRALAETDEQTPLTVANLMRGRLNLEAVSKLDEFVVDKIPVGDATALIIDSRRKEKLPSASPIEFDIPPGWWMGATHIFNVATLEFSADCKTFLVLNISKLPGPIEGEARLALINRWRAQLMLPTQEELGKLEPIECLGSEGFLVDLFDPNTDTADTQRILAAVVMVKDQAWIFKMQATRDLVQQQQKSFKRLVRSAKLRSD